jgi:DNA-directed RNA polymerase subunit K/omega
MPPKLTKVNPTLKSKKEDKHEPAKDARQLAGAKLKSVDDADSVSEEDYTTDDKSGDEEIEEDVDNIEEEENSDDNLEEEDDEAESEDEEEEEEEEAQDDGDCLYRFTSKKKKKDILADVEVEDNFIEDDTIETSVFVDNEKRITKNYMTVYERVRLLGERAKQLSLGAKPLIKGADNMDPKVVAKMELEQKIIPLIIIRTLPNGLREKWKVSELKIIN